MNLMITLIFENSFQEVYLPNINNKAVPISISSEVSGYPQELTLSLEVWDNKWFMLENEQLIISDKEGRLKSAELTEGFVLQCSIRGMSDEAFSISVAEAAAGNIGFEKYLIDKSPITIGSDKGNVIHYNEKFIIYVQFQ